MNIDPLHDSTLPGAWDSLWSHRKQLPAWDYLSHIVFSHVLKSCSSKSNQFVMEAGSGSGRISARIQGLGHSVCQIDNSLESLRFNRKRFGSQAKLLAGDIRAIPMCEKSCGVVWSSGVLEHFRISEMTKVLAELKRITKEEGVVLTLVPYSRCAPYRVAKWILEKIGLWHYGREDPLQSLREPCESAGLHVEAEYTIAFSALGIQNLQYIPGLRWIAGPLARTACFLYDLGPLRWYDQWSSFFFGGYLLVNISRNQNPL